MVHSWVSQDEGPKILRQGANKKKSRRRATIQIYRQVLCFLTLKNDRRDSAYHFFFCLKNESSPEKCSFFVGRLGALYFFLEKLIVSPKPVH